MDALGCEFLTLSAHKINGPKGVGAIYWRGARPWLPLVCGGDQEHGMRAGTEPVHQIAAFGVASRLAMQRMTLEQRRLAFLRAYLVKGLQKLVPDLIIHEAEPSYQLPGTLNLAFPGQAGIRVLAGLDCVGVAVSVGSACTADRVEPSHTLIGMGISETEALASIRVSMGVTTSRRDLNYFVRVLPEILRGFPKGLAYLDPQHLTQERLSSPSSFVVDLRVSLQRLVSAPIPSASRWSPVNVERHFKKVPRDKEVILICDTGYLSLLAGHRLARWGHPNVKVLYGGYVAWNSLQPGGHAATHQDGAGGQARRSEACPP